MKFENNNYNENLKTFARQNRKTMTKAEASLWKYVIKDRQLEDVKFLRQRPIDNYIVDFCSLELKLIIEVDGGTHNIEDVYKNDVVRQKYLEELGFIVVRFTDEQVLKRINAVRLNLVDVVNRLKGE
jgi:very-short-patch-repair endonuclease